MFTQSNWTTPVQVNTAFGLDPKECPDKVVFHAPAQKNEWVPTPTPGYEFRMDLVSTLLAFLSMGETEGLCLTGCTGTGKTSLIVETCARLRLPLQMVTAHPRMEVPELVISQVLRGGELVPELGPMAQAMLDGHVLLINELDVADPAMLAGLNDYIEGSRLLIKEIPDGHVLNRDRGRLQSYEALKASPTPRLRPVHRVNEIHPDFRFAVAMNTNGSGDHTGLFQGTGRMNLAFMDRFLMVEVPYPSKETEQAILKSCFINVTQDMRDMMKLEERMVRFASKIRAAFEAGTTTGGTTSGVPLTITCSTRSLKRWARLIDRLESVGRFRMDHPFIAQKAQSGTISQKEREVLNLLAHTLDLALANRAEPDQKQGVYNALWDTCAGITKVAP